MSCHAAAAAAAVADDALVTPVQPADRDVVDSDSTLRRRRRRLCSATADRDPGVRVRPRRRSRRPSKSAGSRPVTGVNAGRGRTDGRRCRRRLRGCGTAADQCRHRRRHRDSTPSSCVSWPVKDRRVLDEWPAPALTAPAVRRCRNPATLVPAAIISTTVDRLKYLGLLHVAGDLEE